MTKPSSHLSPRLKVLLSLYFLVCISVFVLRTLHWKLVNDPAQLDYLCFLMDHGMAPYRDLLEINMPGIYLVNWTVMHTLGGGSLAWRCFDLGLGAAAAWAMISIARAYDWLGGAFAAALFILYHGKDGAGQQGQRDLIIAVLLLCAYAFVFHFFRRRATWAMLAAGLCCGIATTIKPTPLPFMLLVFLLAALRLKKMGQPILRPMLYASVGLLAPCAVVFLFLASTHSLSSFWYVLRVQLPFYEALGRLPFFKLLLLSISPSVRTLAVIALLIALLQRDWFNWERNLLLAGAVFGFASFMVQGKGFPYHRYPLMAFLFLWAGMEIVSALRAPGKAGVLAKTGLAFSLVLLVLYAHLGIRKAWAPQFSDALTLDLTRLGGNRLSGHVQCIDMPADCDETLYRMRLVQSTGLFYDYLIFGSPQQQVIRDARAKFWGQFERNTPQVVVVGKGLFPDGYDYEKLASWPLLNRELSERYYLYDDRSFPRGEAGIRAYRIYVEKNSLVAERHQDP